MVAKRHIRGWQALLVVGTGIVTASGMFCAPAVQAQQARVEAAAAAATPEIIEADVSTRSIPVTSGFTGKEIIVFGAISRPDQESVEKRAYDIVVAVQGPPAPVVTRRKSNIAGLWMNAASVNFDRVPSFYTLSSTKPLEKIADSAVFDDLGIGYDHIRITPRHPVEPAELKKFRDAVIRLKMKERLYLQDANGVKFKGRTLFRSTVLLPANVPLGSLSARVYLFRDRQLLSTYAANLQLEREGVERWLYNMAIQNPLLYGLFAVFLAMSIGFLASEISRRTSR